MDRVLRICDLGLTGYSDALEIQETLFELRVAGIIPDTLLLLEHEHVLTLGRRADEQNVLEPLDKLLELGIAVEKTGRGGDVTYHGPGQLVGYPVVALKEAGLGVSDYVSVIEDSIIETLAGFGLAAGRDPRNRGVWIGNSKIAAIGLRVRKQVSIHGFALNVSPDLAMYSKIVPCGIANAGVTSMQREGCAADMKEVKAGIAESLAAKLGYSVFKYVKRETIEKA